MALLSRYNIGCFLICQMMLTPCFNRRTHSQAPWDVLKWHNVFITNTLSCPWLPPWSNFLSPIFGRYTRYVYKPHGADNTLLICIFSLVPDHQIQELLELVQLSHLEHLVISFDTHYGEEWQKMLSPGEQQRLIFARVFYRLPRFAGTFLELDNSIMLAHIWFIGDL